MLYCYLNMPTINKTYLVLSYLMSKGGNCKACRKVALTEWEKYSKSLIKNDNFTVKLLFLLHSKNSLIHSYLYNKLEYFILDHEYLTNLN